MIQDKTNAVPMRRLYDGGRMPSLGMGTFGSDKYSPQEVSNAVRGALRFGYRLFDCASVYGNESEIGRVFQAAFQEGVVQRSELFVISKLWNDMHGSGDVLLSLARTLRDLRLEQVDLYLVHWPFPNAHAPGCDEGARDPLARPFRVDEFMKTWRQMERLQEMGLTRYIGMSNMTVPKLEAVLPLCRVKPAAIEMELHPCFQQEDLFRYCMQRGMQPIGYCPLGSPSRPERDQTAGDAVDMESPQVLSVAKNHGIHPALVCLKWAVQRGEVVIPFSAKESQYIANLECLSGAPLTDAEMELLSQAERGSRLVKGHVFLWEGAKDWTALWDMDGTLSQ